MEQDKFVDVDGFLSRRAAPPHARPDLAENIIHAAVSIPKQNAKAWNFKNIFSLSLPRIAMAASVVLCVMVTAQWNTNKSIETNTPTSLQQPAELTMVEYDEEWSMVFDVYNEGFSL